MSLRFFPVNRGASGEVTAPRPFISKEKELWLYRRLRRNCGSPADASTAPRGKKLTLNLSLMITTWSPWLRTAGDEERRTKVGKCRRPKALK